MVALTPDETKSTKSSDKAGTDDATKKPKKEDEVSEEDRKMKDDLNMLIETLQQNDKPELYQPALDQMRTLIRSSTTSMTSVPKPLKFMLPHIDTMKEMHTKIKDTKVKNFCADIISVLMMVSEDPCGCLNYRLIGTQGEPIGDWGHEYVRHLCTELTEEWKRCDTGEYEERVAQMLQLARDICTYNMAHNAETEACDLLMEIERLDQLKDFVEAADQPRVCRYLLSCVPYVPDPENVTLIHTAYDICIKHDARIDALRCAIMLNNVPLMKEIVLQTTDPLLQQQMAIILGRHQIFLDLETELAADASVESVIQLNSNAQLYQYFQSLARELDIVEAKTPEDIYKVHLEPARAFGSAVQPDSAKSALANAFVNGLVNTGFGKDKHITPTPESANKWYYRNRDYGILSAAASTGLIMRWDLDGGINACDRFLYVKDDFVKAGNLLAMGICSSGIQDQVDPAAALLLDYVNSDTAVLRVGSILGLGLAYANSKRPSVVGEADGNVLFELRKVLNDTRPSATPEVKAMTALSIGLIAVGTGNAELAMTLTQYLMERTPDEMAEPNTRFIILALALLFLGMQNEAEVTTELVRTLPQPWASLAQTCVEACAFAGTGNVLKVQSLLHICSEHFAAPTPADAAKKVCYICDLAVIYFQDGSAAKPAAATASTGSAGTSSTQASSSNVAAAGGAAAGDTRPPDLSIQQSVAALGVGLIAMGEDIGSQMAMRSFAHLFRYGEPCIRRSVPLGMAMLSVSNPQLAVVETLHKYSHDADAETAYNAILALGIVGAGSNNARLSNLLRQLAVYHAKDAQTLMLVRIAQGLTHMGKGTMTLNPYHSDRQLMCPVSVAALMIVAFAFLDARGSVLNGRQHYLLYCLVPAIQPRMLITLIKDGDQLKQANVPVRVGQAVDNVGQAGRPKSITGFRTHTTPVLLATGERAELVNDEYISLTPYLEGLVILKKNPEYKESASVVAK